MRKSGGSRQSEAEIERLLGPSPIRLTVVFIDEGMYEEEIGADEYEERLDEILREGLEVRTDRPGEIIHYPPHSILKILAVNPEMEVL